MVNRVLLAKLGLAVIFMVMVLGLAVPAAYAADAEETVAGGGDGLRVLGLGIGAGLAVGLTGLAPGNAQTGVGSGGTGAMAERPELFTNVLILFAIPETIVILGFVIAFLLLNNI